jgi:hypothetical protein
LNRVYRTGAQGGDIQTDLIFAAYVIEQNEGQAFQGYFARTYCEKEFAALGLKNSSRSAASL